ncbi:variable surface protein Vir3, truncated, putative, partial [Plasmodium vivax]
MTTHCTHIKKNCCSYLNYWLDKKRKEKVIGVNDAAWQVIEKLWGTLKNSSVSCKRQHYDEPLVDMKKCFDFMVYCVNRDELKHKCQQNDDGLKSTYCDNFNAYTKHYYEHFTKKVTCLRDTNKDIHYNWKFSDTCTLHNMAKTFPKYDKSRQKIVDDTSRLPINKC